METAAQQQARMVGSTVEMLLANHKRGQEMSDTNQFPEDEGDLIAGQLRADIEKAQHPAQPWQSMTDVSDVIGYLVEHHDGQLRKVFDLLSAQQQWQRQMDAHDRRLAEAIAEAEFALSDFEDTASEWESISEQLAELGVGQELFDDVQPAIRLAERLQDFFNTTQVPGRKHGGKGGPKRGGSY